MRKEPRSGGRACASVSNNLLGRMTVLSFRIRSVNWRQSWWATAVQLTLGKCTLPELARDAVSEQSRPPIFAICYALKLGEQLFDPLTRLISDGLPANNLQATNERFFHAA